VPHSGQSNFAAFVPEMLIPQEMHVCSLRSSLAELIPNDRSARHLTLVNRAGTALRGYGRNGPNRDATPRSTPGSTDGAFRFGFERSGMASGGRPGIVRETVRRLRTEAETTNERRLLVLCGASEDCRAAAETAVEAGEFDGSIVSVSDRELVGERIGLRSTAGLLGTTHDCLVVDCHAACLPNTLGRTVGAVDGGGLLILLAPPLDEWPGRDGGLEELLAAPPYSPADVGDRFKRRLVRTLRSHRGIAIVDVDSDRLLKRGCTDPAPRRPADDVAVPESHAFPAAVYEACLTADQSEALLGCERLRDPGTAVVLEADRGRGKSSAAGLAAASLAADGADVLVTAPGYRNAAELFERAAEALRTLGSLAGDDRDGSSRPALRTGAGGVIRFEKPQDATEASADVCFVDEAAALPVRTLETLLSVAPATCFTTTVRGYEGSGRGFDVRFRDRLEGERAVTALTLSEPIRYAPGDPIEVWLFHALSLGATPPPAELFDDATPTEADYERLDREELAADETRLREAFGLLVAAHYRTEPNDFARLLDAPNVAVRALTVGGHVVSVALSGLEGGLDEPTRRAAYEGERIDGNLVPDLLTSQLRDPDAAAPVGLRVMRIATHHAARSSGFGSALLEAIASEFGSDQFRSDRSGGNGRVETVDYLATSYGATPELLRFWRENGYRAIHLSATRNDTSGEHSAVMLRPLSSAGRRLADRHAAWFRRRFPGVVAGPLESVDPDVVRGVLAATAGTVPVSLSTFEWRLVASAAHGPGRYGTAPDPFRRLAFRTLLDGRLADELDAETERLLVVKALQGRRWETTAETLGFVSERAAMRALGDAFEPILAEYGTEAARREADRFRSPE
jgi:tRNA(Met) cytidine acetyltransferase